MHRAPEVGSRLTYSLWFAKAVLYCVVGRDSMDMGSLRAELQLPHHFITGEDDHELDEDIMMLGSTPQVHFI